MSIHFKNQLEGLIQNELQYNYKSMIFTFVVDPMTQTAEFFSTSKFTTLLNHELLNNMLLIVNTNIHEPTNGREALHTYRRGNCPLHYPRSQKSMECEENYSESYSYRNEREYDLYPQKYHKRHQLYQEMIPHEQRNPFFQSDQTISHHNETYSPFQSQQSHSPKSMSDFHDDKMSSFSSDTPSPKTSHQVDPEFFRLTSQLTREKFQSLPTPIRPITQ